MITPELAPSHQDTAADAVATRWVQRAMGASIVDPVRLRMPNAAVAAYRDNRWPLQALGNQCTDAIVFEQQRRRQAASMGWRDVEPEWRDPLKRVAWLMINKPVPDHLLLLPGSNYTARPGAGTILFTILRLIMFLRWLRAGATNADVTEIRHIDQHHLQQWVKHIHGRKLADPSAFTRPLTYLWAWGTAGELPAGDVLVRPFWIGQEPRRGSGTAGAGDDGSVDLVGGGVRGTLLRRLPGRAGLVSRQPDPFRRARQHWA